MMMSTRGPVIGSLLDLDLYKLTQCQLVLHRAPENLVVQYRFTNRTLGRDVLDVVDSWKVHEEVSNILRLRLTDDELAWLRSYAPRGIRYFQDDFVDFLATVGREERVQFHLNPCGQGMGLTFWGPWRFSILYETLFLSAISELYSRGVASLMSDDTDPLLEMGRLNLRSDIDLVRGSSVKFVDFGTRRRFSGAWHREVVQTLARELPNNFVGTSNVMLAKELGLPCVGTVAHETFMTWKAVSERYEESQHEALCAWLLEYRDHPELLVALSDTYGSKAFFEDFARPLTLEAMREMKDHPTMAGWKTGEVSWRRVCDLYSGVRQDSGDPFEFGERAIDFYKSNDIDPATKRIVFSDGLDFRKCLSLQYQFGGRIGVAFGVGTHLTNNCGMKPLSIVIKSWKGKTVDRAYNTLGEWEFAKLSDDAGKNTGSLEAVREAEAAFL